MATMRAVVVNGSGKSPSDMAIGEVPRPVPGPHEILVKVSAFGINRADTLQRAGGYPPPAGASSIMGLEIAGTVAEVGPGVEDFKVGDRAFGLVPGGAYAEFCTIHKDMATAIPAAWSFEQAAALPEVWMTAYQALCYIAGVKEGEDVLIHAAASGVGTCLLQLAKAAGARNIIATAGTDRKLELAKSLGATHAINYKKEPEWHTKVKEITGGRGVDVIIDFVAGSYFKKNIESVALDGRIIMLALLGGIKADPDLNLALILMKRIRIQGSTLRTRSLPYQIDLVKYVRKDVYAKIEKGELKSVIDKVFPWTEIAEAHKYLEADQSMGKVVITVT
ncbi:quinone oxidoreductase [Hyaloraphidium curvatum]|nr:quinone oxidoreductase [Hyaloraphidium curvatum]